MTLVVAIDGPAGSGKSSVSKAVARRVGFGYLDTGAAYRSLAWTCLQAGVDLTNSDEVASHIEQVASGRPLDPDSQFHIVGGVDITEDIRGSEVSAAVSSVAQHPGVRQALNLGFRQLAEDTELPGVIIEGRDITTVVAPGAPVRILLTADEATRIARRQAESAGLDASTITNRDRADSAVVNFMTAADGVTTIDTTDLSFEDTVQAVLELISQAGDQGAHK